jgi:hypothetical protein
MDVNTTFARWLELRDARWYAPGVALVGAVIWGMLLSAAASPVRAERQHAPKPMATTERPMAMPADTFLGEPLIEPKSITSGIAPFQLTPLSEIPNLTQDNPVWQKLDQQLRELQTKRQELLRSLTPRHPAIHAIDADILSVEEELQNTPRQFHHAAARSASGEGVVFAGHLAPLQNELGEPIATWTERTLSSLLAGCAMVFAVVTFASSAQSRRSAARRIQTELGVPVLGAITVHPPVRREVCSHSQMWYVARWFGEGTLAIAAVTITAMVLFSGQSLARWVFHPLATMNMCLSDLCGRIPRL